MVPYAKVNEQKYAVMMEGRVKRIIPESAKDSIKMIASYHSENIIPVNEKTSRLVEAALQSNKEVYFEGCRLVIEGTKKTIIHNL